MPFNVNPLWVDINLNEVSIYISAGDFTLSDPDVYLVEKFYCRWGSTSDGIPDAFVVPTRKWVGNPNDSSDNELQFWMYRVGRTLCEIDSNGMFAELPMHAGWHP